MKKAIVAIAPDSRQGKMLSRVMPSWQKYAKRYGWEILVIHRSITGGSHPYWDRWLAIQETEPEVAGFGDLLLLDNDVSISDDAPDILSCRGDTGIAVVEESAQQSWKPAEIPAYYRSFHVEPDQRLLHPDKVFNFGVSLLTRDARPIFQTLYEKWRAELQPRFAPSELKQKGIFYRLETDGPFLSYELQALGKISALPAEFNFIFPSWLRKAGISRLPLLAQAKVVQRAGALLPRSVISPLTSSGRSVVRRAAAQCHFLHFAASKSPLWLLPDEN